MPYKIKIWWITLIGIPLLVGLVLGANQTRAGAYLPWLLSIGYWMAISLGTWLLIAAGTSGAAYLLRPWTIPDWVVWLVGALAGSLAARPAIYWTAGLFQPFMQGAALREMPKAALSLEFVLYYITNWSVVIAMWVAICWIQKNWVLESARNAESIGNLQELASMPNASAAQPLATAGFLQRLPTTLGRDILALHSEDHYVRVYTRLGDTLVLAAISDAISTLEAIGIAGQRVHRSWWIAMGAATHVNTSGRRTVAILENGLEIPVSQTYREMARHAGALPERPVTGFL